MEPTLQPRSVDWDYIHGTAKRIDGQLAKIGPWVSRHTNEIALVTLGLVTALFAANYALLGTLAGVSVIVLMRSLDKEFPPSVLKIAEEVKKLWDYQYLRLAALVTLAALIVINPPTAGVFTLLLSGVAANYLIQKESKQKESKIEEKNP